MVIRAEVYHRFGGLDEDFFAHMEEIDLCWKIQRSNYRVMYCGNSAVYHMGGGTLASSNPAKTYYNFRNGINLLIHHLPGLQLMVLLPARIILDYVAALKFLIQGTPSHTWAVAKAHYHVIKALQHTLAKRRGFKGQLPYSTKYIYKGSAVFAHYLFGKKRIILPLE